MCLLPGVFVLDRALRMRSGVISTRDRMLARAGLEGVTLVADWLEGAVGVPGDGRGDGLAAKKKGRSKREGIKRNLTY